MRASDGRSRGTPASAQRGFTYIWMLLLIALMGVGMTVAADVQTTVSQRDREKELLAIGRQFRTALASYYAARLPTAGAAGGLPLPSGMGPGQPVSGLPPAAGGGGGANFPGAGGQPALPPQNDPSGYPASLEALLKDERFPGIRRHLRKVFVDPMTGKAEWGLVQVSGRIVGIHSLSTAMPIKQAGFEGDEQAFTGAQSYAEWIFGPLAQMPTPAGGKTIGSTSATSLPSFSTTPFSASPRP
ncbi:type II secretion system GspH family protein [Variovorax sp. ZS18.2.2]|uniref:type II secretion system protein n=1 Tax=Variovorax sp. ZS18.2.2 TaxID=2971255 RepID=UPI002150801F|nr:type II secretion system protein [Variovorax sp. ZS18.2.2]MCR6478742.1 type II secretion system GspH family protein [Variovorax sp. ZS18.2.2]